jgi:hypothetical protein
MDGRARSNSFRRVNEPKFYNKLLVPTFFYPVQHLTCSRFFRLVAEISLAAEISLVAESEHCKEKNAEYLKQIFPEKEYRGLSPNFHIHIYVTELYISTIGLLFLLEEICGQIQGIYKSLTDT